MKDKQLKLDLKELSDKIQDLKDLQLSKILKSDISKIDKLELIYRKKLLGEDSLPHKLIATLFNLNLHEIDYDILDAHTRHSSRYETITYSYFLEWIGEQALDHMWYENNIIDKDLENIPIATTIEETKIYKSYREVIDKVFDYCIENKVISFKLDW